MTTLPPPNQPAVPVLWAPRLRGTLTRFFAWMDRRKARHLARVWLDQADARWRADYAEWWTEHGWLEGADNPDLAYHKAKAARR